MNILSIQGCMAVGKTTFLQHIERKVPDIYASYEWDDEIINKIKQYNYDKSVLEGFIGTQRLWMQKEIDRYEKAKVTGKNCVVMDFGAEEIEFYTISWPKAVGKDWNMEILMKEELSQLRKCLPSRILYLEASYEKLLNNKKNDQTRTRNYFETYYSQIRPFKEEWFRHKENVDYINTEKKTLEQVSKEVIRWVNRWKDVI